MKEGGNLEFICSEFNLAVNSESNDNSVDYKYYLKGEYKWNTKANTMRNNGQWKPLGMAG